MPLAAESSLALSVGEIVVVVLAVVCAALFLWGLVAVGQSRRIEPIGKVGYLVLMLAFPLLGPLYTLWVTQVQPRRERRARREAGDTAPRA